MDIISILLGLAVVLIFMAIFSLLRTMRSPFIKRFESIVRGRIEPLSFPVGSYYIRFSQYGKSFELYEIKSPNKDKATTAYNHFIFLKVAHPH